MTDQEFLQQFESCTLPKEMFRHTSHIRICWLYLHAEGFPNAIISIQNGIKRYAKSLNALHIYHETMTLAWIRLIAKKIELSDNKSFPDFMAAHPELGNSQYIYNYYSKDLLQSETAKTTWIEPDLHPLTADIHLPPAKKI